MKTLLSLAFIALCLIANVVSRRCRLNMDDCPAGNVCNPTNAEENQGVCVAALIDLNEGAYDFSEASREANENGYDFSYMILAFLSGTAFSYALVKATASKKAQNEGFGIQNQVELRYD